MYNISFVSTYNYKIFIINILFFVWSLLNDCNLISMYKILKIIFYISYILLLFIYFTFYMKFQKSIRALNSDPNPWKKHSEKFSPSLYISFSCFNYCQNRYFNLDFNTNFFVLIFNFNANIRMKLRNYIKLINLIEFRLKWKIMEKMKLIYLILNFIFYI